MLEVLKGMSDKIDITAKKMETIFDISAEIFKQYGFERIYTPLVEATELFKRGVGETTDVVGKEMYDFKDKGGRDISLRPEGTAGVVRAYLNAGKHKANPNYKCFYMGPMYRYEAPQKGRYREFIQIGVESFGNKSPLHDAEIIQMAFDVLNTLKISDLTLEINDIGTSEDRNNYKKELIEYLEKHFDELSEDSKKRLHQNPLRVLDSKDKKDIEIVKNAPKLSKYINEEEKIYFKNVQKYLDLLGIKYVVNDNLVRGLDYYSSMVFEIKSSKLGAQSTVCGGGRYDKLLEILGGVAIPAMGFSIGADRLLLLLDDEIIEEVDNQHKVYIVYSDKTEQYMLEIARELRDALCKVEYEYNPKSFGNQLKKADKLGYKEVVILGEDELKENVITIKNLEKSTQETKTLNEYLGEIYDKNA